MGGIYNWSRVAVKDRLAFYFMSFYASIMAVMTSIMLAVAMALSRRKKSLSLRSQEVATQPMFHQAHSRIIRAYGGSIQLRTFNA